MEPSIPFRRILREAYGATLERKGMMALLGSISGIAGALLAYGGGVLMRLADGVEWWTLTFGFAVFIATLAVLFGIEVLRVQTQWYEGAVAENAALRLALTASQNRFFDAGQRNLLHGQVNALMSQGQQILKEIEHERNSDSAALIPVTTAIETWMHSADELLATTEWGESWLRHPPVGLEVVGWRNYTDPAPTQIAQQELMKLRELVAHTITILAEIRDSIIPNHRRTAPPAITEPKVSVATAVTAPSQPVPSAHQVAKTGG